MKTEKQLISRSTEVIESEKQKAIEVIPALQQVIDEGKTAELEITNDNFLDAVRDPEVFAKAEYEKTIDRVPTLNGRKMTKEAIMDTYEFPDTTKFVQAANAFKAKANRVQKQFLKVEGGKALINEDQFNIFIEKCSMYVSHPDAIELWNTYNETVEAMNKLRVLLWKKHGNRMTLSSIREFVDNRDEEFVVRVSKFNAMTAKFN